MLQAGRHRASTHKGVDVTAFHACAFAARGRLHSYWHAARPTLRPLSPAQDIFSRRPLRASAFGMCVLICDVLCQIQGQLARAAGFPTVRPARRMYPNNLPHLPAHPRCGPPKNAHPSSKRIGWIGSVLITWATCWLGRGAGRVFCPVGGALFE